ncbi:multidrug ABC transporter permease [Atopobacter sp. AH10]|uniref:multidrug ABC transporter permease n=1 Tax=Atopobacter sp. AH10 TaxID=2315861 RepID=UPI000EF218F6|nr:multidrug ABC transporter permease [Atopobacter sp. AH10]RLK62866.1 multidrug ABC transporter permease [Atopobacter sp. AH10]
MKNFIEIVAFHLKLFSRNSYFVWLMLTSTVSLLLLQYLAAYAGGTLDDPYLWRRAAVFGLWSCGTTACGSIGFQRSQGTLLYLLNNRISDQLSLAAVVIPAASFGLLPFPLAYLLGSIMGLNVSIASFLAFVGAVLALWIGAVILDLAIAGIFVLTPRALVYEDIVTLPILFFSGLFHLPGKWMIVEKIGHFVIPISLPIQWLTSSGRFSFVDLAAYFFSLFLWGAGSIILSRYLFREARKSGQLGGIGL